MTLGVSERAAPRRRTRARLGLALIAGMLAWNAPAFAKDPLSLKEVLERAQSDAEKKAVEDLVGKLKGVARTPPASAPAPAATPQAATAPKQAPAAPGTTPTPPPQAPGAPATATTTTPSTSREPPTERVATPAPEAPGTSPTTLRKEERVATPATPAPPQATATEEAIKSAEEKAIPSVDLEVFFAYDSAEITPEALGELTTLGRALQDVRLVDDAFLIVGHTDRKGGAEYNQALSQRRAEAVRQFLISNFGIDESKLVAKGYGFKRLKNAKRPLADENRRVQIVNLSKDEQRR